MSPRDKDKRIPCVNTPARHTFSPWVRLKRRKTTIVMSGPTKHRTKQKEGKEGIEVPDTVSGLCTSFYRGQYAGVVWIGTGRRLRVLPP